MSSKKKQTIIVSFKKPAAGAPAHLVANADLQFQTGLLSGLRLTGFALWNAKKDGRHFISVTVPCRTVERHHDTVGYFDYVRGDLKRLKASIVERYWEWAREEGLEEPPAEDSPERGADEIPY